MTRLQFSGGGRRGIHDRDTIVATTTTTAISTAQSVTRLKNDTLNVDSSIHLALPSLSYIREYIDFQLEKDSTTEPSAQRNWLS